MDRLHIDAKDDLVLRLAHRDQPVGGLIELIWNSLDAEAGNVEVVISRDAIDGLERVEVIDDGHGIAPEGIPGAFVRLGGSWKAQAPGGLRTRPTSIRARLRSSATRRPAPCSWPKTRPSTSCG